MSHQPHQTVAQALAWLQTQGLERLPAQQLLLHSLGRPHHARSWLISHDQDPLPAQAAALLQSALQRLRGGEPMGYVLGQQDFYGLTLTVTPATLVPRPDTETLVDWAMALLRPHTGHPRVLDLGTGSGAVALALAHHLPHAEVWATDQSAQALAVAQANAHNLGLTLQWAQGDWFAALPGDAGVFDLVASNPPYIAEGDPHLPALWAEPQPALTSGADGLDALRTLVANAPRWLRPGGWLLLEHGFNQAPSVQRLLQAAGFTQTQTRPDLAGRPRCSGGQWPHPRTSAPESP